MYYLEIIEVSGIYLPSATGPFSIAEHLTQKKGVVESQLCQHGKWGIIRVVSRVCRSHSIIELVPCIER